MGTSASKDVSSSPTSPQPTPTTPKPPKTPPESPENDWMEPAEEYLDDMGGVFRGVAVAARKAAITARKVAVTARKMAAAKAPAVKAAIREVGQNRPLAFASEGAVAGESMIPRLIYYGAWTLSGIAVGADIYTKQDDAKKLNKQYETALYWTVFHIPATLVVPAYLVHQVIHQVEHVLDDPKSITRNWTPRTRSLVPVAAALLSIVPIVPLVDHTAEFVLEPTLGAYLGLEFDHHHGHKKED